MEIDPGMETSNLIMRSLLLPLENSQVLLPSSTVTEVLPYSRSVAPQEGWPEWVVGGIAWHGRQIPVVSLEHLFDGVTPEPSFRTRVAILNAVGESDELTHYALISRSIPRLVTLEQRMLELDEAALLPDGVKCRARLARQPVYIPDLDWIEASLIGSCEPLAA